MKFNVTMTMSLEEAHAILEWLRPLYATSAERLSYESLHRKELFRKLWDSLRDDLPPVNARLVDYRTLFGTAGQ